MMPDRVFWKAAAVSGALAAALALATIVEPPRYHRTSDTWLKRAWRTLYKDEVNREAREQNTAAYYEQLLNEGSRVSLMNRLMTGDVRIDLDAWNQLGWRQGVDFRVWGLEPGFVNRDANDPRRDLAINSQGLADREYAVEKPPGVWRLALLGDSVTQGQGAPMFSNFETRLEERLNDEAKARRRVEILNLAVAGYRIAQLVDVATEVAPRFGPDVYVLPLSPISVFRRWADHLTTLIQNGQDLKYDYLRALLREARISRSDPRGTIDAKLARFRLRTVEWAVRTIRDRATAAGAGFVVILLPDVTDPEVLDQEFEGVREMLGALDVPVIDLLDAFALVDDPQAYRVGPRDRHPNTLGHQHLYQLLYRSIMRDPQLTRLFTGGAGDVVRADPAADPH